MGSGRDDAESVSEAIAQSGGSSSGGGWCGLLLVVGVLVALTGVAGGVMWL